jgi:hypothetical protein
MTSDIYDPINAASAEICRCRTLLELAETWMNGHANPAVDSVWLYVYDNRRHLDAIDRALGLKSPGNPPAA